jgi:putative ATP-binding cassette transporter
MKQLEEALALKLGTAQPRGVRVKGMGRLHPGPAAVRMLRLLAKIMRTSGRWRSLALIITVVTITVSEVFLMLRLTNWNADFFNALEQKSVPGLIAQTWMFLAIVAGIMLLEAGSLETKLRLQLVLRTHLTITVRDSWMTEGRHYRLRFMGGEHANEDGRIAEDVRIVCEMVVEFFVSLLYAFTQLVLFVGVLWFNSGPLTITVGGLSLTLPGHMVWIALLYAGMGAIITMFVGHPLVRATDRRQTAEAEYRASLVNSIAHTQAIALTRAEAGERRRLSAAFDRICLAWAMQRASLRNLIFLSAGYGQVTTVLPLLILAPRYFTGEMNLGTLMLVTLAFGQVTAALSWVSGNYSTLAQWEASAERVLGLQDAVEGLGDGQSGVLLGTFVRAREHGPALTFRDLSLVTSAGEVLVESFSAEIKPGERVLVEATPEAAEALFRALAGLSFWGAGRIEMPEDCEPFLMGERPYLPQDSLLEVLAEPLDIEKFRAEPVAEVLVHVGLAHLAPLLDTTAMWEQELGIEDQQRLGFARALLHKPRWVLMHDATSALSRVAENQIMEHLMRTLPDAAVITITHRAVAERQFQRRISIGSV